MSDLKAWPFAVYVREEIVEGKVPRRDCFQVVAASEEEAMEKVKHFVKTGEGAESDVKFPEGAELVYRALNLLPLVLEWLRLNDAPVEMKG